MGDRYLFLGALISGALHTGLFLAFSSVSLSEVKEPPKKVVVVSLANLSVSKGSPGPKGPAHESFQVSTNPYLSYLKAKEEERRRELRKQEKRLREQEKKELKKQEKKRKKKRKKLRKREKKTALRAVKKKKKVLKKTPKKVAKVVKKEPPPPAPPKTAEESGGSSSTSSSSGSVASGAPPKASAPPAGGGGGGGGGSKVAMAGYGRGFVSQNYALIVQLIREHIEYPFIARKMGWQGKVVVGIELSPSSCEGVKLVKSSGFSILDQSALSTVKKLCPRFPKPAQGKVLVKVPIAFRLTD